jgi:hypothetical protein
MDAVPPEFVFDPDDQTKHLGTVGSGVSVRSRAVRRKMPRSPGANSAGLQVEVAATADGQPGSKLQV